MITELTIQNVATYTSPVNLSDIRKVNYIFGANGSGKTTIGRAIEQAIEHTDCKITWAGGSPLEVMVYNRDFVERNFNIQSPVRGVFSLGENQVQAEAEIAVLRPQIEQELRRIRGLNENLHGNEEQPGRKAELSTIENNLRDKAWIQKQKHDAYFQNAFTGVRNNAERFKERVLHEVSNNHAVLLDIDTLKSKATTVFSTALERAEPLPLIIVDDLLRFDSNQLLQKPIIGAQDVNISKLINQLGNADWVKQGLHFHQQTNNVCPFCQQSTTKEFSDNLGKFFNEEYENDIQEVIKLKENYVHAASTLETTLEIIKRVDSSFIPKELFAAEVDLLKDLLKRNIDQFTNKLKEPSRKLTLESVGQLASQLIFHITVANTAIEKHNQVVLNIAQEKLQLTSEIWKFVLAELQIDIAEYLTKKTNLQNTIQGMEQSLDGALTRKRQLEDQIKALEKQSTSVQPTKDAINNLLKTFGFTSFTIEIANDQGQYKICREDGSDARQSLSEGEKTFITFLYFYYLIKGAQTSDGTTTNRIVVFDDPISSLDSDVLYIVSSLIKSIFEEIKTQTGYIKQIFVLTHNVYFHKEISFSSKRSGNTPFAEESFWMVKKLSTGSNIERCSENPIKSAYELLWNEVKSPNQSSLTLQNTLRRILENYFTMWGGKSKDELCESFSGKDKLICQSLFSWVNDGSHSIHDDLYINHGSQTNDSYLQVFKQIFINANQVGHYNMMMGLPA
ncbi:MULTISPECIES: AAA family ATPase [unclassified Methylophilus]|uniref:AAA family ATPase n=1 Tax=unclassified Methylophilus TaxID=2630143 RepID=UPI0006FAC620|nr:MULTISPECIES: AAA family ATPase [unclassified Methylophilus]KQT41202.1 AAA family ATPase [Methylophilus sp. Leaf416]KQT58412.1 AAA family ATPase [Methylophilus sp. Leaf459]